MENNMAMEYPMFCYQCEQTAGGKGCTKMGVCGKTPEIAALQDLLIYQIKGISCYAKEIVEKGENVDKSIVTFIENSLFTTLTNVNFDADFHVEMLKESQRIKEKVRKQKTKCDTIELTWESRKLICKIEKWEEAYEEKSNRDCVCSRSAGGSRRGSDMAFPWKRYKRGR